MDVAIGIDTHKGSLTAAAVDALGKVLGIREFPNDPTGHRSLLRWVREQGQPRTIGIEESLNYGSAAARTLLARGEDVREVAASLTHIERRRRVKGKSDPVDAVAIARVVAADETLPSARRTAALADLKLLVGYRDQLVHARTQVANRPQARRLPRCGRPRGPPRPARRRRQAPPHRCERPPGSRARWPRLEPGEIEYGSQPLSPLDDSSGHLKERSVKLLRRGTWIDAELVP